MKNLLTVLVVGVLSVAFVGCCGNGSCPLTGKDSAKAAGCSLKTAKQAVICSCGEIKGTKNCCNKNAVKCGKCGLIKGSVACCKPELVGKTLCVKCGEIKGTAKCCDKTAKKCKCGAAKKSPGCCKESFKEFKEIIFDNDESDL